MAGAGGGGVMSRNAWSMFKRLLCIKVSKTIEQSISDILDCTDLPLGSVYDKDSYKMKPFI